jgi:DNA-binding NtrC family response regulator
MSAVFIVDESARGLAADLNAISKREKLDVRFQPVLTLEQMFLALEDQAPDLILLHHHWLGLSISQALERIAEQVGDARVIVFTGQSVDVEELVECVRSGVADYWTKRGQLDPVVVFRQIAHYCSGPEWTMKKLRVASGSQRELIRAATNSLVRIAELSKSKDELEAKVRAFEDQEHAAFLRTLGTGIKFAITIAILTGAFIAVNVYARQPVWVALAFVVILAVFFLLLEGKLAEALIKWPGGSTRLKSK